MLKFNKFVLPASALVTAGMLHGGCATAQGLDTSAGPDLRGSIPATPPPATLAEPSASAELAADAVLDDYRAYAALHNAELEAAYYRWQAALHTVPQARTLPDPKLTYARYLEEVETRVGAQENRVGLAQTFPWFGTLRARGDRAAERAEAVRWRYEQAKLALDFRVTDTYAEYYYLGRATRITQANLDLVRHFEEVARRRYEVAKATYSDVIKAQVELGKLSDRVRSLRDMRPALAAALNAALNRPADAPVPWPRDLPEPVARYDTARLRAGLANVSPTLQALNRDVQASLRDVELARLRYFPSVTVGVDWIDTNDAIAPTPDSGKDPVVAMISISLPIWHQSYRAAEREAEAKLQAAVRMQTERRNSLASALERTVFRYEDARRRINLYRDTLLPKAQQALQAAETAFTAGSTDFLNLIDAQRVLLEFQLSFDRALADATQRQAEIATIVGRRRKVQVPAHAADAEAPAPPALGGTVAFRAEAQS